jgi:hypothetical protein
MLLGDIAIHTPNAQQVAFEVSFCGTPQYEWQIKVQVTEEDTF